MLKPKESGSRGRLDGQGGVRDSDEHVLVGHIEVLGLHPTGSRGLVVYKLRNASRSFIFPQQMFSEPFQYSKHWPAARFRAVNKAAVSEPAEGAVLSESPSLLIKHPWFGVLVFWFFARLIQK